MTSIAISGTEENINKWKESLDNITNQKVVGVDKETLIPIYELCVDKTREAAMKDYIENRLVLDMAREESEELARSGYQSSTVAHIGSLPSFESESENGTLIKDIYMGGQHVARVCNEYIPCLNKQQRVSVIYPVAGNKVKYNLGYWPGNVAYNAVLPSGKAIVVLMFTVVKPKQVMIVLANRTGKVPCFQDCLSQNEELVVQADLLNYIY